MSSPKRRAALPLLAAVSRSRRLAALPLLAAVASPPALAGVEVAGEVDRPHRKIVLAVGINDFAHIRDESDPPDAGWQKLFYAAKDAEDIVRVLQPYGFAPFSGRPLTGPRATKARIRAALEELLYETQRHAEIDYDVVLYFSSHGFALDGPDGRHSFIVATDTAASRTFTAPGLSPQAAVTLAKDLAVDREDVLNTFLERLPENVKNSAVIYDACFVAGGKGPRRAAKGPESDPNVRFREDSRTAALYTDAGRSTLVLASVSYGQQALEEPRLQNSLYTHFFVEGLSTAAPQVRTVLGERPISLFAAHHWATDRVLEWSGNAQLPSWAGPRVNEGSGFFYLEPVSASNAMPGVILVKHPRPPYAKIEVWPERQVTAKGTLAARWDEAVEITGTGVAVPGPGRYGLRIVDTRTGDVALRAQVDVGLGESFVFDAAAALERRPRHIIGVYGGYAPVASLWGRERLLVSQPTIGVRYSTDGWPGRRLRVGGRLEGGVRLGLQREGFEEVTASQSTALGLVELGLVLPIGVQKLVVGPQLGAGAFMREVGGQVDTFALYGGGLFASFEVPLTSVVHLSFDGFARVLAMHAADDGVFMAGGALSIQVHSISSLYTAP